MFTLFYKRIFDCLSSTFLQVLKQSKWKQTECNTNVDVTNMASTNPCHVYQNSNNPPELQDLLSQNSSQQYSNILDIKLKGCSEKAVGIIAKARKPQSI